VTAVAVGLVACVVCGPNLYRRARVRQEVWLGFLRRLIPRPGQGCLPGALGARCKLSPIVWAFVVRTSGWSGVQAASAASRMW
jgi:hypothetical protein